MERENEIYSEGVVHMILQADQPQELQSANWRRLMEAGGVAPV